jgi:hypothetical protein
MLAQGDSGATKPRPEGYRRPISHPAKVRNRRSKGLFSAPWQEALQPISRTLLKDKHFHVVELGFVERASLHSRLRRLSCGLDCNQNQLRNIIVLELWLRKAWGSPFAGNHGVAFQRI